MVSAPSRSQRTPRCVFFKELVVSNKEAVGKIVAYMAETSYYDLDLLPASIAEGLFSTVFTLITSIYYLLDLSRSPLSELPSFQVDGLFGRREGFTRSERGPLTTDDQVIESDHLVWSSPSHELLYFFCIFFRMYLVLPR